MKKLTILILTISVLLTSCIKEAKQTIQTDNNQFKVELLFEVDGCKVYRFRDKNHSRYFTTCNGSISSQSKHDNFEIQTVVK